MAEARLHTLPQSFAAREVAPSDVPQALPLLRATWPGTDLARWENFAVGFCADRPMQAAITGLFDGSGGLCGLFASHIGYTLSDGRFLAVPLFTVVDIGNSLGPVQAMIDAAARKAAACACPSFEIRLTPEQGGLLKRLRHLGLQHRASVYSSVVGTHSPDSPPVH